MSYRLPISLSSMLLALGFFFLGAVSSHAADAWSTDWMQAQARSAKEKKFLLIDFTGSDWCIWCKKLDKEIYQTSEFREFAAKNLVLLKIDFPISTPISPALKKQNEMLKDKYSIESFPTVLLINPAGEAVGQLTYMPDGPKAFIDAVQKLEKQR